MTFRPFIIFILLIWIGIVIADKSSLSLLSLSPDQLPSQQTCASLRTCDACYRTTGCHFCVDDQRCHAIGSFYGCLWGASCDPAQCFREKSEYIGTTKLGPVTIISVIGACLLFCTIILLSIHVCMYGCLICRACFGRNPQTIDGSSLPLMDQQHRQHDSSMTSGSSSDNSPNRGRYRPPVVPTRVRDDDQSRDGGSTSSATIGVTIAPPSSSSTSQQGQSSQSQGVTIPSSLPPHVPQNTSTDESNQSDINGALFYDGVARWVPANEGNHHHQQHQHNPRQDKAKPSKHQPNQR